MTLRIAFLGTPEFAVPSLTALLDAGHQVCAVVSQPSKPAGRGQVLTPPPVAAAAVERGLPVYQWERLSDVSYGALREHAPDLCVVVAYGKILPQRYLDLPRLGCVNVHASLLPRWRGAAPIQWAVVEGDSASGVCIMRMEAGLDTGPVYRTVETPIGSEETSGALHDRLAVLGAAALVETVADLEAGRAVAKPQPEAGVTYARRLEKADGHIDWSLSAAAVHNRIRGMSPWPGAWVERPEGPLKLLAAGVDRHASGLTAYGLTGSGRLPSGGRITPPAWRPTDERADAVPGTILGHTAEGPVVACGEGAVVLTRVQRAGRKPVTGAELVRGAPDFAPGRRL